MAEEYLVVNNHDEHWDKEEIPDQAILFCYVHKNNVNQRTNYPLERAFKNTPFDGGTDLSYDWDKYSTAEQTRQRLSKQPRRNGGFKNPEDYFVVEFRVQDIKTKVKSQTIEHDPIQKHKVLPDNRAHSRIVGEKDAEVRLKLVDICKWAIPPS